MTRRPFLADLTDTLLRFLPRRAATGLHTIGDPDPHAPVLLTGNFSLTVRRVKRALEGRDAWLVVADSRGVNVWCAAAGGHITHRAVRAALASAGERVATRRVLLPPMLAPGIEQRRVEEDTGWSVAWGPMHLEDLPRVLDSDEPVPEPLRRVRFDRRDRRDMALAWAFPLLLVALPLSWVLLAPGIALALAVGVPTACVALFRAIPTLPVTGRGRWITGLLMGALATLAGIPVLALLGPLCSGAMIWLAGLSTVLMLCVASDAAGTTPVLPGSMDELHARARLALRPERCTGCGRCTRLCPTGVLLAEGGRAWIAAPERCLACAACAVQCPASALWFEGQGGPSWEPEALRATRSTLLGKRRPHRE
jgi:NAD-dependent dihydropyrimidine dehydrogenase PreA subunit